MSYAVGWSPIATGRIDAAWETLESAHQRGLLASLEIVERQLTHIPLEIGESRETLDERVLIEPPLVVYFQVDQPARRVRVLDARVASVGF